MVDPLLTLHKKKGAGRSKRLHFTKNALNQPIYARPIPDSNRYRHKKQKAGLKGAVA
jgi:hypothetical protein